MAIRRVENSVTMLRILQTNLNHTKTAQDLCVHNCRQWRVDLVVISEPYITVADHNWIYDMDKSVLIIDYSYGNNYLQVLNIGHGYVCFKYLDIILFGVYISPNISIGDYFNKLTELEVEMCKYRNEYSKFLIAGDFNAKSITWGSKISNLRGEELEKWAASLNLNIINSNNTMTCIRPQGESAVDVTWASAAMMDRITWKADVDDETLSDHIYIHMWIRLGDRLRVRAEAGLMDADATDPFPRWNTKTMNKDSMSAALLAAFWEKSEATTDWSLEVRINELNMGMNKACDAALKKTNKKGGRAAYWWNNIIAELRKTCLIWRRRYTRMRRKRNLPANKIEEVSNNYKIAKRNFRQEILKSKKTAWLELLEDLDNDPWGRAYKIVLKKLNSKQCNDTCASMDAAHLDVILSALFPKVRDNDNISFEPDGLNEIDIVSPLEMDNAFKKMAIRRPAPGPDGLDINIWKLAYPVIRDKLIGILQKCIEARCFPEKWKSSKLILINKPGKPPNNPSSYRPICLVNEISKIYERVIGERINKYMIESGNVISRNQYGFRRGYSTIDAIGMAKSIIEEKINSGAHVMAISLDIFNAFNSVRWSSILRGMQSKGIPAYLQKIVLDYLSNREISYKNNKNKLINKKLYCGVPQGSVLGTSLELGIRPDCRVQAPVWIKNYCVCG